MAVDLDEIQRQTLERVKAGQAAAKIVEREFATGEAQALDHPGRSSVVMTEGCLRHFEANLAGFDHRVFDRLANIIRQRFVRYRGRRQVQTDHQPGILHEQMRIHPKHAVYHPAIDLRHQAEA